MVCIFKIRALQLQINISLICQLIVLKMLEHRLWYHPVAPWPAGTEMSLRRIYAGQKYPHVYTLSISTGKNQSAKTQWYYTFQQKSTSTWLPQRGYNFTGILHRQKIKYKSTWYGEVYITKAEMCSQYSKRASGVKQERNWEEEPRRGLSFCYTLIVTEGSTAHSDQLHQGHQGPVSRIWTWESRVVRRNPASTYNNARWCA